jgi:hypothetical protein
MRVGSSQVRGKYAPLDIITDGRKPHHEEWTL